MKAKMFDELLERVREGGAILRGESKPSRRFGLPAPGIRAIREQTRLSQSEFASLMRVSVKTLQNWEQDRRRPTGPAAALLKIMSRKSRAISASCRARLGYGRCSSSPWVGRRPMGTLLKIIACDPRPGDEGDPRICGSS
jgi:putative transcriptional regulator